MESDPDINQLLESLAAREKAGRDKMSKIRQREAEKVAQRARLSQALAGGATTVQRTIRTGQVKGSEALRKSPEEIVLEGRRQDWETLKKEVVLPMPPEESTT